MKKLLIRLTRIRRDREAGRTLAELIFGVLLIAMVFLLIGTIFLPGRWFYLGGTLVGTVAAVLLVINMYDSIEAAVSMNERRARRYASWHAVLRILVTAALLAIAIWISVYSFVGVCMGVISIKLSGLMHPLFERLFVRLMGEERPKQELAEALPSSDDEDEDGLPELLSRKKR
ncbi:MAG: ATP synthase subunit I [Eubacterium sp.]|nr:ATP synthase subunit I [Eubacterium sp.]